MLFPSLQPASALSLNTKCLQMDATRTGNATTDIATDAEIAQSAPRVEQGAGPRELQQWDGGAGAGAGVQLEAQDARHPAGCDAKVSCVVCWCSHVLVWILQLCLKYPLCLATRCPAATVQPSPHARQPSQRRCSTWLFV